MKGVGKLKEIFSEYISEAQMAEFRPVQTYCGIIEREQALQDIEQLIYIIDNRYCGKECWERKGIEFLDCYQEIRDFVLNEEEIYISDFCRAIHRAFDRGIIDNHFSFASPLTGRLGYHKQYAAYFADLLVEQRQNKFYGIKVIVLMLRLAMKYRINTFYFQRWHQRGTEDILWEKEVIKIWIRCQFM